MLQEYFSALIQLIAGFGFAGLIIILSIVFGRRSKMRSAMDVPYECGNIPVLGNRNTQIGLPRACCTNNHYKAFSHFNTTIKYHFCI